MLFWGRFIPATVAGVFVAIAVCWIGYLIPYPWRNEVVAYVGGKPLPIIGRWIAGIALLFGLAVTFFPRPRDGWGRVQYSWFDLLRELLSPSWKWWR